jgi:hypothetical protein
MPTLNDQLAGYEPHFMAIVDALRTAGLTVGEGWGRDNAANDLTVPYVTVESTSTPSRQGPVGRPFDDARLEFQTRCVARSARACEVLRDRVAVVMYGGLAVTGRRVWVTSDLSVGVFRDPDVHELFDGVDRWTLWTTPDLEGS